MRAVGIVLYLLFVIVGGLLILIGVATWRQDRDQRTAGTLVRGVVTEVVDGSAVIEYADASGSTRTLTASGPRRRGSRVWVRLEPDDRTDLLGGPSAWFHYLFIAVGVALFILTAILIATGGGGGLAGT